MIIAELFHQGQRLSAAALDAQQRRVVSAIEGAANDAWHVGHPGWKLIAYQDQAACLGAEGLPLPAHVESIKAELEASAARQMHHIFSGGAPFTDTPEATRTEACLTP